MTLPAGCREIMERIHLVGGECYAVGGAVRDALLCRPAEDVDMASSLTPEEIIKLFEDKKLIPTGKNYGTVGVMAGGEIFEVTTFRSDGYYGDLRRPDSVTFTKDIRKDLARRDFTVNAMAWSEEKGLIDPFGGQKDLADRLLCAVGEPEKRFGEDALRIMRLVRFISQLGFSAEENTGLAAHREAERLRAVSGERLSAELKKLLAGESAISALTAYRDVLAVFLGRFDVPPRLTGEYPADLALFYRKQPKSALEQVLERLKVSRRTRENALFVHENLFAELEEGRVGLRLLLFRAGEEKARLLLMAREAMGEPPRVPQFMEILTNGDVCSLAALALKGRDAEIMLGTRKRETGEALAFLLEAVMRERVENEKEKLIQYWKAGR